MEALSRKKDAKLSLLIRSEFFRLTNEKKGAILLPFFIEKIGDPRRTRTFDPMVKSLGTRLVQFRCGCLSPIPTRFPLFPVSLSSPGYNDLAHQFFTKH